jgi:formiminotetrahydrofolate cyclodeaminase
MLIELPVERFLDALAARSPTPGGGTAGAMAGAMGAALGLMALRYSKLEESSVFEGKLEEIRSRLARLVDEDAQAYDEVSRAFKLPKTGESERQARADAIQSATRRAAGPPLEGMREVREALTLIKAFAPESNRNLASDLASAAILLAGAGQMMALNVRINVKALKDPGGLGEEADTLLSEIERLAADVRRASEAP